MLPEVVVHSLITVDGKIEGFREEAIAHYYQVSAQLEADTWLIGSDTLLEAERQREAIAHPDDESLAPLRDLGTDDRLLIVVPDSRGRARHWTTHVEGLGARGAVALVSKGTPRESREYYDTRNIPFVEAGDQQVDYRQAFARLVSDFRVRRLRTDSGGVLNSILLEQGLVTELSLIVTPDLVGTGSRDLFRTFQPGQRMQLELMDCQKIGRDLVWLRYTIGRP